MTENAKPTRSRAARLREQARNCLAIAIGHTNTHFAAELIDEAVKLAVRARELDGRTR